jgi:hypothetical protein
MGRDDGDDENGCGGGDDTVDDSGDIDDDSTESIDDDRSFVDVLVVSMPERNDAKSSIAACCGGRLSAPIGDTFGGGVIGDATVAGAAGVVDVVVI